jgi:serine protease Do
MRSEKMGYLIRDAQTKKIPYTLVIGDKEVADNTVTVRKFGEENTQTTAEKASENSLQTRDTGGGGAAVIPRKKSILPFVILLILMAAIAVAAVVIQTAKGGTIENREIDTQSYPTVPVGTGAGITVNISQNDRPKLDDAAYENPETGLFSETGIGDWVVPSQLLLTVYKEDMSMPSIYGTGTVLTKDGYLLTCAHVVDDAVLVNVYFTTEDYKEAEIIAIEKESDLALLKVEADNLVPVIFGKSDEVMLGEKIVCASAAGRYLNSLTFGNVTNLDRNVKNGYIEDGELPMMQVSCYLNPGSSGGPVFNMYGQCIGIAVSKLTGLGFEGVGFIINADYAVEVAERMMGTTGAFPADAEIISGQGVGFMVTEAVTGGTDGFIVTNKDEYGTPAE